MPDICGLSPRLRGNRRFLGWLIAAIGSIPAPAGNLYMVAARLPFSRSIPRLRGNRSRGPASTPWRRSIPAPAGEPSTGGCTGTKSRVYPRACGGTTMGTGSMRYLTGLSPRLRGNLLNNVEDMTLRGSIPAPAGEPFPDGVAGPRPGVYPRACGGTAWAPGTAQVGGGLSPRLRGNHGFAADRDGRGGSIPAPAGEPPTSGMAARPCRVYPRACGGTPAHTTIRLLYLGLSPRLRGNRPAGPRGPGRGRSIPAPAGEPQRAFPTAPSTPVYPRACGGTRDSYVAHPRTGGLSPRLRGNPWPVPQGLPLHPVYPRACGEPCAGVKGGRVRGVYPRACGGTRTTGCRRRSAARSIPAPAGEPWVRAPACRW